MSIKPILFNTEMVTALLEGRKTETRRIVKPGHLWALKSRYRREHPEITDQRIIEELCLPPYRPGDVLWVRESWAVLYNVTGWPTGGSVGDKVGYIYKADNLLSGMEPQPRWRPSIHMPKEAARLFLEVTEVHAERLQDITAEGCLREGVEPAAQTVGPDFVKGMFSDVWDSTMDAEKRKKFGWDANPWVWVIKFRQCERPEDWQ